MSNNKKSAVMILAPGFPRDEQDTACLPERSIFTRTLAEKFPGMRFIVIAFHYPYDRRHYHWKGVEVISLQGKNRGMLNRFLLWRQAWAEMRRLNREYDLKGCFAYWLDECAFVADRFCRKYKIPRYTWLLGQDARAGNRYVPLLRPEPGSLVAISDFLAEEFHRNYGIRPAYIITPGIDPELFSALPQSRDIDILGAGSLIPLKQYDIFIRVVSEVSRTLGPLTVRLCGDGPDREKLKKLAGKYLPGQIRLEGERPHGEVLGMMQRSRIFLHTSAYEGYGIVHAEALYAGAQVVSFSRPVNNMVNNWHAVKTEQEMTETIIRLLRMPVIPGPVLVKDVRQAAAQAMALPGISGEDNTPAGATVSKHHAKDYLKDTTVS